MTDRMIAVYGLDANGTVVRDGGPDWLDDVRVVEHGDSPKLLGPTDGERYLRALPDAFSGTGGRATFINQPAVRIDGQRTI